MKESNNNNTNILVHFMQVSRFIMLQPSTLMHPIGFYVMNQQKVDDSNGVAEKRDMILSLFFYIQIKI